MKSFHWIYLLVNLQHCSLKDDCSLMTNRSGKSNECCPDFYLSGGMCIPCPVGYFGPNCSHECPYPSYGHRCIQGECNCTEEMCDVKWGCEGRTSRSPVYNHKKLMESVDEKKTTTNTSHLLDPAKKTVQFNYISILLITVAGTSISVLLLVTIGFQLRSRKFCIKTENDNGKKYSEIGNI